MSARDRRAIWQALTLLCVVLCVVGTLVAHELEVSAVAYAAAWLPLFALTLRCWHEAVQP